ncbi:hypothetical protein C5N14_30375 [Micromonospora sp. MW-13]|nr:hypothetical protein C5N14_30375 [Micromonospora sp. MW-13]
MDVAGEGGRVRVVERQGAGQREAGGRVEPVAQFHGSQGGEAEVLERPVRCHPVRGVVAEHCGDLAAYEVAQRVHLLRGGHRREPGEQRGRRRRAGDGERGRRGVGHQVPGERVGAGAGDGGHPGPVDVGHHEVRLGAPERRGQGLDGGPGRHGPESVPGQAPFELTGAHPAVGPEAPGEGGRRESLGAAALGQRVEEGVPRRVGGLAGPAHDAGEGGEEHEGRQVRSAGQLVEVGGGGHLGPERGGQLVDGHRVDHVVVERGGGVHDGGQGKVVGDRPQQVGERGAVGHVAGRHGDPAAERGQLVDERPGTRCLGAPAADEQEVFGAGSGQGAGDVSTEGTGASGDQHRAARRPGVVGAAVAVGGPDEPAGVAAGGAQRDLVLRAGAGEQRAEGPDGSLVGAFGQVHQSAPAVRVLGAQHAAEAPRHRLGGVGVRVAGADGDRASGGDPEPGGQPGITEGLREHDRAGEAGRYGPGLPVRPVVEREEGQDGGAGAVPFRQGVAQVLGEALAVAAGLDLDRAGPGGVERGHPVAHGRVGVGGYDQQEVRGLGPGGVDHDRLPGHPVPPGVEGRLGLPAASPGGQRREHLGERGVRVDGQALGEGGHVLGFDGPPEGVVLGGAPGAGGAVGARGGVEPVALVVEGVAGQVDRCRPDARLREVRPPVHRDSGHEQPTDRRQQRLHLRTIPTQRRHPTHPDTPGNLSHHRRQNRIRTHLQERVHSSSTQRTHPVGEPHRPPHMTHPVLRIHQLQRIRHRTRHIRHHRHDRSPPRQPGHHRAELVEHRLHQRAVERVTHRQPAGAHAALSPGALHLVQRLDRSGDDDGRGPVHGGDPGPVGQPLQGGQHVGLGRGHRQHAPAGRQRLHQPAPRRHQRARILQRQHPRRIRRRHLTNRMTGEEVRPHPPRPQQLPQRHLHRKQPRLRKHRPIQQPRIDRPRLRKHHLPQRPGQQPIQPRTHLIQGSGEHREPVTQLPTHPHPLRTLTGEQHRPTTRRHHTRRRRPRRHRIQAHNKIVHARTPHHRPVLQRRPRRHQRPRHVHRRHIGPTPRERRQPRRLTHQRPLRTPRHHPRHRHGDGRVPGGRGNGLVVALLQDHVRVRPGDAERRHPRPTRPPHPRPLPRLRHQSHRTRRPVHMRRRLVHMQSRRHHPVPHREDHLDDPRDTGGGLGVPDVRLHRPQQQRHIPTLPVRGQKSLRLDRITQRRTRAMRLHHVHVDRRQTRAGNGLPDHPLLRRTIRRRQPVRRTILIHRRTPHHRQDPPTLPPCVRQPLHQQHTDALRPTRPVRRLGEGLAPPVGGHAALAGEVDEGVGGGHHGHAAGQRQVALPRPQRLHRQVQRHQRGRAGGVDRHRRPLEPERVRHPTGQHAAGGADAEVAVESLGDVDQARRVVVVHHAGEHPDRTAAQGERVDPGVLDRLPGRLQQQPLLRVHREGLVRGDLEQVGVEVTGVDQEAALPGVAAAAPGAGRVVEVAEVPAAVGRETGDAVPAGGEEVPELFR